MTTRLANESLSRMGLGGFARHPAAGTNSSSIFAAGRNSALSQTNQASARTVTSADRGLMALGAVRNQATSDLTNSILPGGCDSPSSLTTCYGLPTGREIGAIINHLGNLLSDLFNRAKGNASLNASGGNRSSLTPPYGGGSGRPNGPIIAPPNLDVDRGGRGSGGDRPDCDFPKR